MPLFLGLDGGGTGCRAVLADEKRLLGRGQAGAANPRGVGAKRAWAQIHSAVDRALEQAGLGLEHKPSLHACFGLAGVGRPLDHSAFLAAPHPFASLRLETDVHIALVGALGCEVGALLAVGTGSMVYGVDPQGRRHRVGGWGFPVGDEGGGAWLGLAAVRAALYAADGRGPRSALTEAVLERYGGVAGLLEWLRKATPKDFGELSPLVFRTDELANQGGAQHKRAGQDWAGQDQVARRLQQEAVAQLTAMLMAFDHHYPAGALSFSAAGSVAQVLLPAVLAAAPARFREGYGEPLEPAELGALRLARAFPQGLLSAPSS